MKKLISLYLFILLFSGCKHSKNTATDIFNPQFNLTLGGLIKDGFDGIPESVPLLGKQIGDTLVYYQFDSWTDKKGKPTCIFCEFPISSIDKDSINHFFEERGCFIIWESQKNDEDYSLRGFLCKKLCQKDYLSCYC